MSTGKKIPAKIYLHNTLGFGFLPCICYFLISGHLVEYRNKTTVDFTTCVCDGVSETSLVSLESRLETSKSPDGCPHNLNTVRNTLDVTNTHLLGRMTDRPSWGWLRSYLSMGGSRKPRPDNLLHSDLMVIIRETEISVPPDMPATLVAAEMQQVLVFIELNLHPNGERRVTHNGSGDGKGSAEKTAKERGWG